MSNLDLTNLIQIYRNYKKRKI